MKKIGIVSYNIYANFTNYGSALQSYALYNAILKYNNVIEPVLVNYCPDILRDKDPLNPMKNMWDKDEVALKMCELSLPAIKINYEKFMNFYDKRFVKTKRKYISSNFDSIQEEGINCFVCGSDTIFCFDEFGFDDGYYSNYDVMKKNYSFSYAASFGDSVVTNNNYEKVSKLLKNFDALGLRENANIGIIKQNFKGSVVRVIDPTLLLDKEDYEGLILEPKIKKRYILLYARRYNERMEKFADELSKKYDLDVIEISLRATNSYKHTMRYDAGVEEFLGLVKNAEIVVTNSYHGIIFALQFRKQFFGFSREQCGNKIYELLHDLGIEDRLLISGNESVKELDYSSVWEKIEVLRETSIDFLKSQLDEVNKWLDI